MLGCFHFLRPVLVNTGLLSSIGVETVKTLVQRCRSEPRLLNLMSLFRQMVNLAIAIGLDKGGTSLKSLSLQSYSQLKDFHTPSSYRLCAISRAAGILKNYRNLSRKHKVRTPYCRRPGLTICYGLKIRNRLLCLPGGFTIPLNHHTGSSLRARYQTPLRHPCSRHSCHRILETNTNGTMQRNDGHR